MLEPAAEQEVSRSGTQAHLVIGEVRSICARRGIKALDAFISACEKFAHADLLNIAIIGRFKAGKSSFLNHLLGTNLLPVGVTPVTSVVTEVEWGEVERVRVEFQNGVKICVDADSLPTFVAEAENPENAKRVKTVRIETPTMAPYRGIRLWTRQAWRASSRTIPRLRSIGFRMWGWLSSQWASIRRSHGATSI